MDKTTKNLAWNTFKQTGNIDTFMELIQVENIEKNMAKYTNGTKVVKADSERRGSIFRG